MSFGRQSLVTALQRLGLTRGQAARTVETILARIHGALAARQRVTLKGFGSFTFRRNQRRRMWDPRTRESRPVNGRLLLRFRPSDDFLRRIRRV